MIIRIGKLCISWGKTTFLKQNVIIVEEDVTVKIPRVVQVEQVWEIPSPVITRVPEEIRVPAYSVTPISHQLIQHNYVVAEKTYPIRVEKPVVEEVEKVVEVQRLKFEEKDVAVPRYKVKPGKETPVEVPAQAVFEITCSCGNRYTTNHTRCSKCGRSTSDNLKDMQ